MRLIDSHAHLEADAFAADVTDVIASARAAGVERLLVPGWDAESSAAALRLTERHEGIDAAVGIHPHDAASATEGPVPCARTPRLWAMRDAMLSRRVPVSFDPASWSPCLMVLTSCCSETPLSAATAERLPACEMLSLSCGADIPMTLVMSPMTP